MAKDNVPTGTVTRKPDEDVGTPGGPAAGGGRQTAQQAEMTRMGSGGRTDGDRNEGWDAAGGEPGRNPPALGGSSAGHSDQKASHGPRAGETVADGLSKAERKAR
ncbi:hypothetical protein [Methylobacterium soli]|uniref:Uncharacterized protein n=1 Tax=Methylobacterium soli TaxID=553447 RepID=A0A6L3SS70_9HYPH|nr:hypothetical protein [Methylobacterium soli]KAB1076398.1 hypothetical protein F6X53_23840 [Methylobacterium soli]